MKNKSVEEEIIKTYVIKNKQERILWELNNPKKRENVVFEKFAGLNLFKNDYIQSIDFLSEEEMESYLFEISKAKDVYFLGEGYLGKLSLKEAVKRAATGEICLIYCGNGIGYYQGEQCEGKPPRILLKKKGKKLS